MYTFKLNRPLTLLTTVGALAIFAAPTASNAEQLPSYASRDRSETIHGTISSVPGKYDLYLRDDRGFTDHVVLHDGTAIFPTGLQLGSGETVTISGHNAGNVFAADSIDTPYAAGDGDGGYADPDTPTMMHRMPSAIHTTTTAIRTMAVITHTRRSDFTSAAAITGTAIVATAATTATATQATAGTMAGARTVALPAAMVLADSRAVHEDSPAAHADFRAAAVVHSRAAVGMAEAVTARRT